MKIELSNEDSEYIYDFVKKIINECGPRMPCSPSEAKAAEIIKKEMEQYCDRVSIEHFECHPKAFLGWIRLDIIFIVISIGLYFVMQLLSNPFLLAFTSIISFLLVLLSIIIMWEEFFNYREFIDPLFRKKSSQNVIGKISKGENKRIIIFSAHVDSAIQFNLLKYLKWGFIPIAFGGILLILIWFVIAFTNLIFMVIGFITLKSILFIFTVWLLIFGSPCIIGLFFFVPSGEKGNVVPGAVDNLSSCSVLIGLGRYLKINKYIIPNDTEIRLIAFGCEEAGLRGAYRYVSLHLDELKSFDALVVNMDGLETPDGFHIIDYEPTTRTKHSEEMVKKLLKAADLVEIGAKTLGSGKLEKTLGRLSGGSDAAAFSKAKVKAGFLSSADWKTRSSYYHQDTDTFDKIKKGTLENALRICIAFLINESKNN